MVDKSPSVGTILAISRGFRRLWYRTRMANLALKCRIINLITARSLFSYFNILIKFGQLYNNSCYTNFTIATLGMCIACEFHQLWAVRPCVHHIFWHLTKWLIFSRIGHACMILCWSLLKIVAVKQNTYFCIQKRESNTIFYLSKWSIVINISPKAMCWKGCESQSFGFISMVRTKMMPYFLSTFSIILDAHAIVMPLYNKSSRYT